MHAQLDMVKTRKSKKPSAATERCLETMTNTYMQKDIKKKGIKLSAFLVKLSILEEFFHDMISLQSHIYPTLTL